MAFRKPRSKKSAGGCLVLLAAIAAIAVFGPVVRDSVDSLFNPWAHSWRGGPTLTGTWVGAAATPTGQRVGLFLDLRRARTGRGNRRYSMCRTCPKIEGAARVCGASAVQAYEVWGGPDTWGGEQFHLRAGPEGVGQAALPRLGFARGEWAGDALQITTTLEPRGERTIPAGEDAGAQEVRVEMRRGGEESFSSLCRGSGVD
jgi:hypothetical protein